MDDETAKGLSMGEYLGYLFFVLTASLGASVLIFPVFIWILAAIFFVSAE
jgi:hypothetical protein